MNVTSYALRDPATEDRYLVQRKSVELEFFIYSAIDARDVVPV